MPENKGPNEDGTDASQFGFAPQDDDAEDATRFEFDDWEQLENDMFENDLLKTAERPASNPPAIAREELARIQRVIEAKVEHNLPKRRRLVGKTNAQPTDYSDTPLVQREEHKRLSAIQAEQNKKRRKLDKNASALAVTAVTNQPELTHGVIHPAVAVVHDGDAPHPSHDIMHCTTAVTTALYCDICGRWSRRHTRSKLQLPCTGEPLGNGNLNMLRHGVIPVRGAKMPIGARRRAN